MPAVGFLSRAAASGAPSADGMHADKEAPSSAGPPPFKIIQQQRRDGTRVVFAIRGERGGLYGNGVKPLRLCPQGGSASTGLAVEDAASGVGAWQRLSVVAAGAGVRRLAEKVFLPIDYPASVSENYLSFVQTTMVQTFFSHVSRLLATQAMLFAVGVGAKTALPLAAVTSWILKDGLGQIGAIAFGTIINTRFDSDPKRYRFHAAVLGKLADYLCVFTLGQPQYFLALSAIGSACGRISQSASQSCRAKIYETFARSSNLGDVLRCSTTQTIATQLFATAVGVALAPIVSDNISRLLLGNACFSTVSLYCAYLSSAMVRMSTLNEQRAELVFQRVIQHLVSPSSANALSVAEQVLSVPSVEEVRELEVFVRRYRTILAGPPLAVNPPMADGLLLLTSALDVHRSRHVLGLLPAQSARPQSIALWLHEAATPEEAIRGFFQACLLRSILAAEPCTALVGRLATHAARAEDLTDTYWLRVLAALKSKGWRTDVAFLDVKERRVRLE